jgi:hypothetical protein
MIVVGGALYRSCRCLFNNTSSSLVGCMQVEDGEAGIDHHCCVLFACGFFSQRTEYYHHSLLRHKVDHHKARVSLHPLQVREGRVPSAFLPRSLAHLDLCQSFQGNQLGGRTVRDQNFGFIDTKCSGGYVRANQ